MSTYVDTSALLAILDRDDREHAGADAAWRDLLEGEEVLLTCSYVVLEAIALAQARMGLSAVHALADGILPTVRIVWIDAETHAAALAALLTANRRQLSLVDCASFDTIRRLGIDRAFTFDRHFAEQGFAVVP